MTDFTTSISVDHTPEQVFNAILNVNAWWSGKITGETNALGDEFTYQYQDMHISKQKVTEFIPNKRLVWHVTEAEISFIKNKGEWVGTDIIFDITEQAGKTVLTFMHKGLQPSFECYDACSNGWSSLIKENLYHLIENGEKQPDVFAK